MELKCLIYLVRVLESRYTSRRREGKCFRAKVKGKQEQDGKGGGFDGAKHRRRRVDFEPRHSVHFVRFCFGVSDTICKDELRKGIKKVYSWHMGVDQAGLKRRI